MTKKIPNIVFVLLAVALVPQWVGAQATGDKATKADSAKKETPPLQLADDAPTLYTVVKGDTLWDISARFLKQPWRWPEIWNMNREQIKDTHWIYPGDVVKLSFDSQGRPMLSFAERGEGAGASGGTVTLNPKIRVESIGLAIPSIPIRVIGPFLTLPLVVEKDALLNSPKIIGTEEGHVIIGAGDTAYGAGIKPEQGNKWQVYRQGRELKDPDTAEILGYEATYLGDVRVSKFGEASRLEVIKATQEINKGDRLTPAAESLILSYSPHAPDKVVKGKVVSGIGGISESAQYSIVILNLGKRDGMEVGHVLATYRSGAWVNTRDTDTSDTSAVAGLFSRLTGKTKEDGIPDNIKLPDERNGLVFVFRVFDKVSYALVMSTRLPIQLGDVVQTP
ncbi:MAG: LysM peptidoglycan-binding domain-containing protein [Betaproteobacteria bacterium]|nr:LysM peptidoglycan-binding domain-containing protein [Betaproteobacteria bacterium]